jgi:hypothetical protein
MSIAKGEACLRPYRNVLGRLNLRTGATLAGAMALITIMTIHPPSSDAQKAGAPIYQSSRYVLWPDYVVEGPYTARAISSTEIESNYPIAEGGGGTRRWSLQRSLDAYPRAASGYPLLDALYNLSLEELANDTREDGAFNAGAKWQGVWTRDVSYSILLSLAAIQPEAAKASLLRKVKRDRIVQDTGTGGSWPVSTDRVTWALAAWEIYLATGDRAWLATSYQVVRNSVLDDEQVVLDPESGLARGESTFLDWREQTYPRWMEPADIYQSKEIGTNAVYYRTLRILAAMARELGQPAADWDVKAGRIQSAVNAQFWLPERGYYGEYLYGRTYQTLSPRAEALGEALAILFDLAAPDRQDEILRSQPLMDYGVPTVFPQTPNMPPYHNRSVWPFVQAYFNLAAAKRQNGPALLYGLASLYRASALFLTNKENFVADTGSPVGTVINSDRQLWSVAANLAMVYRVFFGMAFELDGLHLRPVVPEELRGVRTLTNFHYRQAVLSIEVRGFGTGIRSFTLDGTPAAPVIPASLAGSHQVVIQLDEQPLQGSSLKLVPETTAPETPVLALQQTGGVLAWEAVPNAVGYQIYKDGKPLSKTAATTFSAGSKSSESQAAGFSEYQVAALNAAGAASFLSAPVAVGASHIVIPAGASGSPQSSIALDRTGTTGLSLTAALPASGRYSIAFRYANGSGPVNTDNKCAVRTLFIDGRSIGPIVLPQRGQDQWANWGVSSALTAHLTAGPHRFELRLTPADENMNGEVNRALIESISLQPLD